MKNTYKTISLITPVIIVLAANLWASPDISKAIAHKGFNPKMTSIMIVNAENGKSLADYMPDLGLNPASCAKIVTSTAALSILGPDYHFPTYFYTDKQYTDGAIGTLFVGGTGDPFMINEELERVGVELYNKGIRRITGGIAVDNSYFDSYTFPRKGGNEGRNYTAMTAATSVNFNSIGIVVEPGLKPKAPAKVTLEPAIDYYKIVNKVTTGGKFSVRASIKKENGGETITVTGRIPPKSGPQKFYRSVNDPAPYAAGAFGYWLSKAGVRVEGALRGGTIPTGAKKIAITESHPLSEILQSMNKISNNFMAEQILKHMGAKQFGLPGSTAKGIMAVEEYLDSIGIPKGTYLLENGSGLSEFSKISARQLVQILVAAYKNTKIRQALIDSLSVLGMDGTTKKWRFAGDLCGKVFVKTGTLNGVSTLAGYVPGPGGKMTAFAVLANGLPKGAWVAHEAQLEVVRSIMETSQ